MIRSDKRAAVQDPGRNVGSSPMKALERINDQYGLGTVVPYIMKDVKATAHKATTKLKLVTQYTVRCACHARYASYASYARSPQIHGAVWQASRTSRLI